MNRCHLFDRPGWEQAAACRGMDPDLFHPARGERLDRALEVCESCPVTLSCLAYAIQHRISYGVWGGESERARRELRRTWGRVCERCGTQQEVRAGTPSCPVCPKPGKGKRPAQNDAELCLWCRSTKVHVNYDRFCGWACERSYRRARRVPV